MDNRKSNIEMITKYWFKVLWFIMVIASLWAIGNKQDQPDTFFQLMSWLNIIVFSYLYSSIRYRKDNPWSKYILRIIWECCLFLIWAILIYFPFNVSNQQILNERMEQHWLHLFIIPALCLFSFFRILFFYKKTLNSEQIEQIEGNSLQ